MKSTVQLSGQLCRLSASDGRLQCLACGHGCRLADGQAGQCGQRRRRGDALLVPWGGVSSLALDPIEKKPFAHFHPGREILSFGGLGCSLRCAFCQNWSISQAGRDSAAVGSWEEQTAEGLLRTARQTGSVGIAATYNEPLISAEWVAEVFRVVRADGLETCLISNGYGSDAVWDLLVPVLSAANIDLKCFREEGYRELGGGLAPALSALTRLHAAGVHLEVTTLVVPGFNDSDGELRDIAAFLAALDPGIPWHVSAFFAAYHHPGGGPRQTSVERIRSACALGRAAGLRHVYPGNVRI